MLRESTVKELLKEWEGRKKDYQEEIELDNLHFRNNWLLIGREEALSQCIDELAELLETWR
jgi:hypothetical protein